MRAALLLLLAAPARSALPPSLARIEAELSASARARRLLAADASVPRREVHRSGLPFAVDERGGEAPVIVVDPERLDDLTSDEAEAEYARALALAAVAAPVPLVEAEQAARQWTAQALVEAAVGDLGLSKKLLAAEARPDSAGPVFAAAALFLEKFERDPQEAYWSVESGLPRETARLTELEDLFALRASEIRALKEPPVGRYGVLGGRRYASGLVRAVFLLRAPGALARLRESLGGYDTVGAAPFRSAIFLWRGSFPPR